MSSELEDMPPLRVAVIGLGYWGPNLVRVLHELPEADVVLVCDRRSEQLEAMHVRYPAIRTSTRFEDVVVDPEVEAVAIATPVSTHFELALASLEAGKHTFVEKPLADSSDAAQRLAALATERRLTLMPGHTFLYSPSVRKIHELIASGELGEIYFISASRVNLGLHQADVSVAWDLGPHDFSILRYWLEESPLSVSALSRGCVTPDIPDVAFISLVYGSGTIAHVELSWLAPGKLRRTTIVGSEKMVVYDDTSSEPVRIFNSGAHLRDPTSFGEFTLTYRTGDIVSPRVDAAEPLMLEMMDFCRSVTEGSGPVSSPELGIEVLRTVEAVERSLELDGQPVQVGTPQRIADVSWPAPPA